MDTKSKFIGGNSTGRRAAVLILCALPIALLNSASRGEPYDFECGAEVDHCDCGSSVWQEYEGPFSAVRNAVDVDVLYTTDSFLNTRGGVRTGGTSQGLLDVVLRTDLAALGFETIGGSVVLHGQNNHGPFFQPYVGRTQSSNIDAEPFTAMAEFFWERGLFDDDVIVRIGRQVGAIQFSVMDLAADFTYGGFQLSANNPLPWYPNPTIAATADIRLTDSLRVNLGTFNGRVDLSPWGWARDGKVYNVVEFNYSYQLGDLQGDIKQGSWYQSGSHTTPDAASTRSGNYGFYVGWQQLLCAEECDPTQGLGAFAVYSYADPDRSAVEHFWATGMTYRGLLPSRDADVTGIGATFADFSSLLGSRNVETNLELFYKIAVCESAALQPSLQYVSSPSGIYSDSVVVGLRCVVGL
ncbi:carbohydrate porin [Aeoliella sp.]|uniref:carbohydrate porin n=1 Tax=Aeoliella sp. TaxID=2795800 RepID=UPI003CCBB669